MKMHLGNGNGGFPFEMPDPAAQSPETAQEATFWEQVKTFKAKADEFWRTYKALEARRDLAYSTPQTRASYDRIMNAARPIIMKIESGAAAVGKAVGWVTGIFSDIPTNQLGALQFVPVALITGAIALMVGWLADAKVELAKLESMRELVDQGASPAEAAEAVRSGEGTFLTQLGGELGQGLAVAALIGVGLFFFTRR